MSRNSEVPAFVKEQLNEAQKRFAVIQVQAEKTIKEWVAKGQELQATTAKRTKALGNEVRKQAETFQNRIIQAAGVATQSRDQAAHPGAVEALEEGGHPDREEGRGEVRRPRLIVQRDAWVGSV